MKRLETWVRVGVGAIALAPVALVAGVVCAAAEPQLTPSIDRGAQVAQARCASCHGVALEAASPSRDAPLFRVLSRLYSAQDLQRKLSDISQNGHFEMPAVSIREDEVEDVSAYIASLDGGATEAPPPRVQPAKRPASSMSLGGPAARLGRRPRRLGTSGHGWGSGGE